MPKPSPSYFLNNAAYSGASTSDFTVTISDTGGTVLGTITYAGAASSFTAGAVISNPLETVIVVIVLDFGANLDFAYGDQIVLTFGGPTNPTVIYIELDPSFKNIDGDILYMDTQGVLFTDVGLTTFYTGNGGITDDSIVTVEATDDDVLDETYETLYLSEGVDGDNTGESAELISIVEGYSEDAEIFYTDAIVLEELTDDDNTDQTVDTVLVLDSIFVEGHIEHVDNVSLVDVVDLMTGEVEENISIVDTDYSNFSTITDPGTRFQVPVYPVDITVLASLSEKENLEGSKFFRVGPLDFDTRSLKHMAVIELGMSTDANVYCALEYNYNNSETYKITSFRPVSSKGFVHIPVSAVNFNLILMVVETADFKLDYIKIGHKYVDRSNVRGFEI